MVLHLSPRRIAGGLPRPFPAKSGMPEKLPSYTVGVTAKRHRCEWGSRHGYCPAKRIVNPRAVGQEILTVKEVSELLKIHHSTVYKMIREKRIPAFKIGSDWRFRMDVIASWMAEQTRDAT